jgi:hypothetical protein
VSPRQALLPTLKKISNWEAVVATFQRLPDCLRPYVERPVWVCWKLEKLPSGKFTKPPYRPDGQRAEPDNPATWSLFETVFAAYQRGLADGVGIVLRDTDLIGFDLDNCIDESGNVEPAAQRLIERAGSYVERSPSERGFHIFGIGSGPRINRKQSVPGANGMQIEIARKAEKYFTITGDIWSDLAGPLVNFDALAEEIEERLDAQKKERRKRRPGALGAASRRSSSTMSSRTAATTCSRTTARARCGSSSTH